MDTFLEFYNTPEIITESKWEDNILSAIKKSPTEFIQKLDDNQKRKLAKIIDRRGGEVIKKYNVNAMWWPYINLRMLSVIIEWGDVNKLLEDPEKIKEYYSDHDAEYLSDTLNSIQRYVDKKEELKKINNPVINNLVTHIEKAKPTSPDDVIELMNYITRHEDDITNATMSLFPFKRDFTGFDPLVTWKGDGKTFRIYQINDHEEGVAKCWRSDSSGRARYCIGSERSGAMVNHYGGYPVYFIMVGEKPEDSDIFAGYLPNALNIDIGNAVRNSANTDKVTPENFKLIAPALAKVDRRILGYWDEYTKDSEVLKLIVDNISRLPKDYIWNNAGSVTPEIIERVLEIEGIKVNDLIPNPTDPDNTRTVLDISVAADNLPLVKKLLDIGAQVTHKKLTDGEEHQTSAKSYCMSIPCMKLLTEKDNTPTIPFKDDEDLKSYLNTMSMNRPYLGRFLGALYSKTLDPNKELEYEHEEAETGKRTPTKSSLLLFVINKTYGNNYRHILVKALIDAGVDVNKPKIESDSYDVNPDGSIVISGTKEIRPIDVLANTTDHKTLNMLIDANAKITNKDTKYRVLEYILDSKIDSAEEMAQKLIKVLNNCNAHSNSDDILTLLSYIDNSGRNTGWDRVNDDDAKDKKFTNEQKMKIGLRLLDPKTGFQITSREIINYILKKSDAASDKGVSPTVHYLEGLVRNNKEALRQIPDFLGYAIRSANNRGTVPNFRFFELITSVGADPNIKTVWGKDYLTPISIVIETISNPIGVITYLIKHGAIVTDADVRKAESIGEEFNDKELTNFLKAKLADTKIKNVAESEYDAITDPYVLESILRNKK